MMDILSFVASLGGITTAIQLKKILRFENFTVCRRAYRPTGFTLITTQDIRESGFRGWDMESAYLLRHDIENSD